MCNERRGRARGRQGFTLIEVLIAMVILAVGLLALQAMSIGAARMVARADRQSQFTNIAASEVEAALNQFRQTGAVAASTRTVGPATVVRIPTVTAAAVGANTMTSVTVRVTVSPASGQNHLNFQPVTMVGSANRM